MDFAELVKTKAKTFREMHRLGLLNLDEVRFLRDEYQLKLNGGGR